MFIREDTKLKSYSSVPLDFGIQLSYEATDYLWIEYVASNPTKRFLYLQRCTLSYSPKWC